MKDVISCVYVVSILCFACAEYELHKIEMVICPYLRLTAETKIVVPDGTALGFKPPAL